MNEKILVSASQLAPVSPAQGASRAAPRRTHWTRLLPLLALPFFSHCASVDTEPMGAEGNESKIEIPADEADDAGIAVESDDSDDVQERKIVPLAAGPLNIAIAKSGTGSGTVTGLSGTNQVISCGSDCFEAFFLPTEVVLTASASAGSRFAGWSGACTGTAPTCRLTVGFAGADVTARFNARRTLTVSPIAPPNSAGGPAPATTFGLANGSEAPASVLRFQTASRAYDKGSLVFVQLKGGSFPASSPCPGTLSSDRQRCTFTLNNDVALRPYVSSIVKK